MPNIRFNRSNKFSRSAVRAALKELLICLIKKLVLKTHWGNELNLKKLNCIRVKIKILIT